MADTPESSPASRTRTVEWPEADPQRLKLALARLPTRLRRACELFRELTGLTAVLGVKSPASPLEDTESMRPPVHPLCAEQIRAGVAAPCDEQWESHIRLSLRSRRVHSHTCPLGLHCTCVPVYLGNALVGVAKVVVDSSRSWAATSAATATLALAVSSSCQEALLSVLSAELKSLRRRVVEFRQVRLNNALPIESIETCGASDLQDSSGNEHESIVYRTLDYLHRHYTDPDLCLASVAAALECNGNYLTQRFTQVVGQHMRSYLTALRVDGACRRLLRSDLPIKRIAYESGFRDAARLSRVFRAHVGVSPTEYRRIFAGR